MKQLKDELYANIVQQNDGYDFLFGDEVYLPVYKYSLKITKRKLAKLNLVEEKVLEIVNLGIYNIDEIARILGLQRRLLDITLADLHVKDLVTISSDKCILLKKGEQALQELYRFEKSQDIMRDVCMDALKGNIISIQSKYYIVEKVWNNDSKLNALIISEDIDQIRSHFNEIQNIFNQEYGQNTYAEKMHPVEQELLTIDEIDSVYVEFMRIPLNVFVSSNSFDIDIVAAESKYDEILSEYKEEIISQIAEKKVLKNRFKRKRIGNKYISESMTEIKELFNLIKNDHFNKSNNDEQKLNAMILSSRKLLYGEIDSILKYFASKARVVCLEVDCLDDWANDRQFVGKLSKYVGKATLEIKYEYCRDLKKAKERIEQGHKVKGYEECKAHRFICWKYDNDYEVYGIPTERQVLNRNTVCMKMDYFLQVIE